MLIKPYTISIFPNICSPRGQEHPVLRKVMAAEYLCVAQVFDHINKMLTVDYSIDKPTLNQVCVVPLTAEGLSDIPKCTK